MDPKTKDKIETLLHMGNVKIKIVPEKKVKFYDETHIVKGYEVRSNGELIATYCNIDGSAKAIYPRGSEYKHTSMYGQTVDYAWVLRHCVSYALENLRAELDPRR